MKKYWFYTYSVNVRHFCEISTVFLNKENDISRAKNVVGRWRGNRQTDTHALMVWRVGGGRRRAVWRVLVRGRRGDGRGGVWGGGGGGGW